MSCERFILKVEQFQRLVLLLMVGMIPMVWDSHVVSAFVITKFLMTELLILFLLVAGAVKLFLGGLGARFSLCVLPFLGERCERFQKMLRTSWLRVRWWWKRQHGVIVIAVIGQVLWSRGRARRKPTHL